MMTCLGMIINLNEDLKKRGKLNAAYMHGKSL